MGRSPPEKILRIEKLIFYLDLQYSSSSTPAGYTGLFNSFLCRLAGFAGFDNFHRRLLEFSSDSLFSFSPLKKVKIVAFLNFLHQNRRLRRPLEFALPKSPCSSALTIFLGRLRRFLRIQFFLANFTGLFNFSTQNCSCNLYWDLTVYVFFFTIKKFIILNIYKNV